MYLLIVILVCSAVTFALRAVPFIASKWLLRQRWVKTLGAFLPLSIMVLLVLHTAVGSAISSSNYGLYEIIAIAVTVVLQYYAKNPLCSIFAGTFFYTVLKNGLLFCL